MNPTRLNVEPLEDRCLPSVTFASPQAADLVEHQFAALVPVMQHQLQNEVNLASNLVHILPPNLQIQVEPTLAQVQHVVDIFPLLAWGWFIEETGLTPPLSLIFQQTTAQSNTTPNPPQPAPSQEPLSYPPVPGQQSGLSQLWTFPGNALNTSIWQTGSDSNYFSTPDQMQGVLDPSRVNVHDGYLCISLTQQMGLVGNNPQGVISTGGMISTKQTYGYGTYEFYARVATTSPTPQGQGQVVPGSLTGLFNWVNNSQTEIDMEAYGSWPGNMGGITYRNPPGGDPYAHNASVNFPVSGLGDGFQLYKFVWTPQGVSFYVDNQFKATLTTFVGDTPAHLFVILFGQDSPSNPASPGVNQYMYVQWIRYTAPGDTPIPVS